MTKEEIKVSSQKKVDAITALCKQLQIVISSEQMITDKGFIKQVVYYTDAENYNVDEQPVTDKRDEKLPPEGEVKPAEEEANPAKAEILEP